MSDSGFVDDLTLPGMLHGAVLRTRLPHARLSGIERAPDFDWQDIVFATATDIPGANRIPPFPPDQPLLADGISQHVGEAVLLLAAASRAHVLAARRHLSLHEIPLDDAASEPSLLAERRLEKGQGRGSVERTLAENASAILVEGQYQTGAQEHLYLETQGVLAIPQADGKMEIRGSMQCPFYVAETVASVLGLPIERVRVMQCPTGGGFGGKEDYPSQLAGQAALLAHESGRPVKLVLDRHEDMAVTSHRHPATIRHRTVLDASGRLLASEIDMAFDGGAYTTLSPLVLTRALLHALGPYACADVAVSGRVLRTHQPPAGAFRGFGAIQACFAAERQMDAIAARLGMDPVELRRRNLLQVGDGTLSGQRLTAPLAAQAVLDQALQAADWSRRRAAAESSNQSGGATPSRPMPGAGLTPRLRGVGLSLFMHGAGFTGNRELAIDAQLSLSLESSGHLKILSAAADMGQGSRISLAKIAARVLSIDPSWIEIARPDTASCPDSGPAIASRTAMVVGELVRRAALALKERLAAKVTDIERPWPAVVSDFLATEGDPLIRQYYQPQPVQWDAEQLQGDAYACFGWGCDIAEVEVDPDTYEVQVTGLWSAHDVGHAIAPQMVTGQIQGGCVQGLGFALCEALQVEQGQVLNNNLADYVIPTAMDVPNQHSLLVESPWSGGPFGAKGIGEMPIDGPAPAIAAAIEQAIGIAPNRLPITPESLAAAAGREAPT